MDARYNVPFLMPNLSFSGTKCGLWQSWTCCLWKMCTALLQAKCLPILLYGTEACPLASRDRQYFEFTVNRLFVKLFRAGSPSTVRECQQNFTFIPIESQLEIRTAKFLQAFSATKNTINNRIHYVCCLNSVQPRSSVVYLVNMNLMSFVALVNWHITYCVITLS